MCLVTIIQVLSFSRTLLQASSADLFLGPGPGPQEHGSPTRGPKPLGKVGPGPTHPKIFKYPKSPFLMPFFQNL